MQLRQREDGEWIEGCITCDHLYNISLNSFECNHPKTGHHRYDPIYPNEAGRVDFPEWCPLLRKEQE